jgi:hypothetical protein
MPQSWAGFLTDRKSAPLYALLESACDFVKRFVRIDEPWAGPYLSCEARLEFFSALGSHKDVIELTALNERSIPVPRGEQWQAGQVQRVFKLAP